jgi:tocopherol O-methyltransferase
MVAQSPNVPLNQRIQQFYDQSSGLWEQIWGEHMHHGYYGEAGERRLDRRQAQIDLIDACLDWGDVGQPQRILDLGCGIGGSSLELAQRYGAEVTGITLSPVQAERATERAIAAGLGDRVRFQVADALDTPFASNKFDLVWSMESGEHMADKPGFLAECHRQLKPEGVLLMATWCHRSTNSLAGPLTEDEQRHLDEIYQVYCLPYVISLPEYSAIATHLGFQHCRSADWSTAVAPFWNRVIESAFNVEAVTGLLAAGWPTVQGALALGLMQHGFERGLIRYGLLRGVKAAA